VVGNKIVNEADKAFIAARVDEADLLGYISYGANVIEADKAGGSPLSADVVFAEEVKAIKGRIQS
jgi:CO dehydrogenase nickel-insertion accessory protein CooC1